MTRTRESAFQRTQHASKPTSQPNSKPIINQNQTIKEANPTNNQRSKKKVIEGWNLNQEKGKPCNGTLCLKRNGRVENEKTPKSQGNDHANKKIKLSQRGFKRLQETERETKRSRQTIATASSEFEFEFEFGIGFVLI